MANKKKHGGARKGAGRKKKEPTKVMRIPHSKVNEVKKIINEKYSVGDIVMTIQGPKMIVSMNDEVVRFDDGFAPIDRVWPKHNSF